jgi:phage protein
MLQPKVYIKYLDKVLELESIRFDTKVIEVYDESCNTYRYLDFEDVEFMENTGYVDINKKHICVGDIVEILGVYFEIKHKALKGYVIKNKGYTLSLEYNFDCVSIVGNIYENKELLE